MYRLIYTSRATRVLTPDELIGILLHAVALNGAEDVTGLLMYSRNSFLQILEGDQAAVERRMERIRGSSQHTDIHTLEATEVDEPRLFPDWAMDWWAPDYINSITGDAPLATVSDLNEAMTIIRSHHSRPVPGQTIAEGRQASCSRLTE